MDDIEEGARPILITVDEVLDIISLSQNSISHFDTLHEIRDAVFGTV